MKKESLGYFYLLNTIIFFSTFEVVSRMVAGKISPFQINFLRFFFGGILLLVVLFISKESKRISKKEFLWVTLVGIMNVGISMNLIQLSLSDSNAKASVIAVIISSNPIFVTIFSALIEKEKIKLYKVVGLIIGVLGIGIVFFQDLDMSNMNFKSPSLALASAISFAMYTVLGKKVSSKIGSLKMNAYSFTIGSVLIIPFLMLFKIPVIKFESSLILPVFYLSFFVTGIAYIAYFKGLEIIGTSNGSLVFFIKPVLASVFAIIILKEKATMNLFIGTVFIIMGIYVVLFWEKISEKIKGKNVKTA
ncbi:DMT family transporter [Clostridium sediminicola]|uniref:DMT family transporter n=1 Tax=Clostridium sediminicola TaxID=3114879 RepID=UPI0031F272F2